MRTRETITEKAATAINELNKSALVLARQMKSGEHLKPVADKAVLSAQRKVRTWRKAYFARTSAFGHLPQLQEFHNSNLQEEVETANTRFRECVKAFCKGSRSEISRKLKL